MPSLNVQSQIDRPDLDLNHLIKAVASVMLQEVNAVRQKVGLPAITAEEARKAILAAYRSQNG